MRPSWGLVIVVDSAVLSPSFVLVYTPGLRAYSHLLIPYYVEFLCAAWYQSCLRLVADVRRARGKTLKGADNYKLKEPSSNEGF